MSCASLSSLVRASAPSDMPRGAAAAPGAPQKPPRAAAAHAARGDEQPQGGGKTAGVTSADSDGEQEQGEGDR